jgi:hypothetical protein
MRKTIGFAAALLIPLAACRKPATGSPAPS